MPHHISHVYVHVSYAVCTSASAAQALTGLYVQGWGLSLNCLPASPDSTITLPGCSFRFSPGPLRQHTHTHTDSLGHQPGFTNTKAYSMSPHTHDWDKIWKADINTDILISKLQMASIFNYTFFFNSCQMIMQRYRVELLLLGTRVDAHNEAAAFFFFFFDPPWWECEQFTWKNGSVSQIVLFVGYLEPERNSV